MNKIFDAVIVGTGAAGLYCALNLPQYMQVCIVTKQSADASDSFLAQGGICMLRGEDDYDDYFADTLRAGHFENNKKSVDLMIRSSNSVICDLVRMGVRFQRDGDGRLEFTREGAHSRPRILFHEDITGQEITSTLLSQVQLRPNVTLLENTTMVDILSADNTCGGVVCANASGNIFPIPADFTVLACGGIGGLYKNSTNYPHITGDALAIALRHGIPVSHLNYVQIHPTTLYSTQKGRRFLISESVRGEGALLYDKNGSRFTDELQPRDLLTAAIEAQMQKDGTDHVWEDMRPLGENTIMEHFPHIYRHCLEAGYNVLHEPIPVVPAQHYFMGGITVDLAGRTGMHRLYACGETCCNGVHGKNRLASNSLLESLVFSRRAADDIAFGIHPAPCNPVQIDLSAYADTDSLFAQYREIVTHEIERMKNQ